MPLKGTTHLAFAEIHPSRPATPTVDSNLRTPETCAPEAGSGPPNPSDPPAAASIDAQASLNSDDRELHLRKLEALGRLSGSVAHDFNNLLTVILGATGSLLQAPARVDPREAIREIHESALRARRLTRQILAVSRRVPTLPRPLDLSEQIGDLARLMERLLGDRMDLDCDLDSDLDPVCIDPGRLDQVILNLAVNARDAMDAGGTLRIRTRADSREMADGVRACPGVVVEIGDTGRGMDRATRKRIFEPFFTTREEQGGTGLGLATVFEIVAEAGGQIQVESELGRGTTFFIWFPVHQNDENPPGGVGAPSLDGPWREPSTPSARPASRDLPRGRVLLVEDDPSVMRLVARVLRNAGQTVLEARDVASALDIVRSEGAAIDLVITDLILPDASGLELLTALEEGRGGKCLSPVILMSGYSREEAGPLGPHEHRVTFLAKPFQIEELEAALRTALEPPVH